MAFAFLGGSLARPIDEPDFLVAAGDDVLLADHRERFAARPSRLAWRTNATS